MCSDSKPYILEILKEASAQNLIQILESINGAKDLVIDKEIICSLDYIANFTLLKKCNVVKVFKLEPGPSPGQNQKCVYLIRPKIENARIISDHINANLSIEKDKQYWVIYVSRKLFTSERVFEMEGVYGYIKQLEFPLGFVTLDKDLMSLEINDFYKSFFLVRYNMLSLDYGAFIIHLLKHGEGFAYKTDYELIIAGNTFSVMKGDLNYIHAAAKSLVQLCNICGPIPKIFGQGRCAKMVVDLMTQMMQGMEFPNGSSDRISHLILLDRDIDYAAVLLSQLTYEGVLDETFGINSGRITFPKEVTRKEPMKFALNNSDMVYEEIRNAFFSSVFVTLKEKARQLQAKKDESSKSLQAMKDFVNNEMTSARQQHSSLCLHVSACEVIMKKKTLENFQERLQIERDIIEGVGTKECINYIEDVINRQDPYETALRLMCFLSVTQNGLSSTDYKTLVTQFRQSYGSKHMITFHNLKKTGLLVEQPPLLPPSMGKTSKMEKAASVTASRIAEKVVTVVAFPRYSSFKSIAKKFNLITDNEELSGLKTHQDINYVFGGAYTPLIGRITEQVIVNDSFKNIEDGLKLLPGSTIMHSKVDKDTGHVKPSKDFKAKTILVYVLGGITYAEVAALRLLQKQNDCRIFIATTSLISGNSLIHMLSPPGN